MIDLDKVTRIMYENNWSADVDKLFIAILDYLGNDKKKMIKEYSVQELCDLCKKINGKKRIVSTGALNYPKNILFSNSAGRDYIIFSEKFDVDSFTKNVNGVGVPVRRRVEEEHGNEKVYINPKYTDAVYAGKNEKIFITEFESKYKGYKLNGKKVFGKKNGPNISVDNSIYHENKKVLIEIDSGNMAKLLVGQYFLLNELIARAGCDKSEFIFVVVHFYKDYNPERTGKNLKLVQECIGDSAIKFKVFTQESFMKFYDGNDIRGLVDKLFNDK